MFKLYFLDAWYQSFLYWLVLNHLSILFSVLLLIFHSFQHSPCMHFIWMNLIYFSCHCVFERIQALLKFFMYLLHVHSRDPATTLDQPESTPWIIERFAKSSVKHGWDYSEIIGQNEIFNSLNDAPGVGKFLMDVKQVNHIKIQL